MADRLDSLGRRIPKFDRSAAAKKAQQTNKEKYGDDFHSNNGTNGGRASKRGYFGTLKDAGKEDVLKAIGKKAANKRWEGYIAKDKKARKKSDEFRGDSK